jgi:acetylornithine deacetylase/succinyl-diaminopimelate desuccinylase-like protein
VYNSGTMRLFASLVTLALLAGLALAHPVPDSSRVRAYRQSREHEILREFVELLAIPNLASDADGIRRNAAMLVEMMRRRGLEPKLLEASDPSAPPAVYGERLVKGATRTLVFYAHYDGQPPGGRPWTDGQPWEPVFRSGPLDAGGKRVPMPRPGEPFDPEWRLYARSASDDKGGVVAILTALDALAASGIPPTANLKFFFEGEEEAGSPHLADILARHKRLLGADAWIICDGPVNQSGRKQVVYGVRGDANVDVTVYGPKRPLHSGHYGNWAPNPAMTLARLLATMKDDAGRVTIAGWYDDVEPLGEAERRAITEAPQADAELRSRLGIGRSEGGASSLLELLALPSLNVNGISSGDVGAQARNVIPTTATVVLDLRLVKGNDHTRQVGRLVEHIRRQGFHVVDRDPTDEDRLRHPLIAKVVRRGDGYNAERTRMDLPISIAVAEAVQSASRDPIVKLPTLGGSLPLSIFRESIGATTIVVPIANYDNNQHAEDENIRLQNLWDGIEIMAAIMTMRGGR